MTLRAKGKKPVLSNCVCSVLIPAVMNSATALKGCQSGSNHGPYRNITENGGPLGSKVTAGLFRNKVMIDTVNLVFTTTEETLLVQEAYDIFADLKIILKMEQNLNSLNTRLCY